MAEKAQLALDRRLNEYIEILGFNKNVKVEELSLEEKQINEGRIQKMQDYFLVTFPKWFRPPISEFTDFLNSISSSISLHERAEKIREWMRAHRELSIPVNLPDDLYGEFDVHAFASLPKEILLFQNIRNNFLKWNYALSRSSRIDLMYETIKLPNFTTKDLAQLLRNCAIKDNLQMINAIVNSPQFDKGLVQILADSFYDSNVVFQGNFLKVFGQSQKAEKVTSEMIVEILRMRSSVGMDISSLRYIMSFPKAKEISFAVLAGLALQTVINEGFLDTDFARYLFEDTNTGKIMGTMWAIVMTYLISSLTETGEPPAQ